MAILQVLGSDKAIRLNHFNVLGLVQNLDYQTNFNAQDVNEMGNTAKLATEKELEVTGSFVVNASGALPGILARMTVKRNPSTGAFLGYQYASGGAGGMNAYTITEADINEVIFDLLEHERTDSVIFNRTTVFPRSFLTGISCRVDANGRGQTTINFAGDYLFGAVAPFHDIKSYYATRTTGTSATIQDSPVLTNHTVIYVYVNERQIDTDSAKPTYVTFVAGTGVITFVTTEGFTLDAKDIIKAIVYKSTSPATIFPQLAVGERSTTAYFMKGYQVSVYLDPANLASVTAPDQWLRVQTLDWNVDLRVTPLRQIAFNRQGTSVYARVPTTPLNIQMTATITETDWADWASVMNLTFDGSTLYQNLYSWAPAQQKEIFGIVVKYYTTAGVELCEWRFRDVGVRDPGTRAAIGGRGEVTWTLAGNTFTLIGFNG